MASSTAATCQTVVIYQVQVANTYLTMRSCSRNKHLLVYDVISGWSVHVFGAPYPALIGGHGRTKTMMLE